MKPGQVIKPLLYTSEDFPGDKGQPGTTISEGPSDGKLEACWKCPMCGHSIASPLRQTH